MQIPLLIYSDSVDLPSGLGRIARDLATHVATDLPQFRVGTYGRAGNGTRHAPFAQYQFAPTTEDQWGMGSLQRCWQDFAGSEKGIIFTIQDPSRMLWFAQPQLLEESSTKAFLQSGAFERWGYFPVDSTGPGDKLTGQCCLALKGYDRVLAYTKFGQRVLSRSLGADVDWIPHGLDMDVFAPQDRKAAKVAIGFKDSHVLIGCNMTNQPRKDWGLWANMAALLKLSDHRFRFWANVDTLNRHWDLRALIEDYGLSDVVKVTFCGGQDDEEMAYFYSSCDVTVLPSLGEGFGFPIVESMACGVPCVHGDYAGGAEFTPWLVPVQAWRLDTPYNCSRPVFDPGQWASKVGELMDAKPSQQECRDLVAHLDWKQLWPAVWRKWFAQ